MYKQAQEFFGKQLSPQQEEKAPPIKFDPNRLVNPVPAWYRRGWTPTVSRWHQGSQPTIQRGLPQIRGEAPKIDINAIITQLLSDPTKLTSLLSMFGGLFGEKPAQASAGQPATTATGTQPQATATTVPQQPVKAGALHPVFVKCGMNDYLRALLIGSLVGATGGGLLYGTSENKYRTRQEILNNIYYGALLGAITGGAGGVAMQTLRKLMTPLEDEMAQAAAGK